VVESPASSRAGLHPHEFEHDARGAPPRERRARLGDLDAGQYDDDLAGHFDDVAQSTITSPPSTTTHTMNRPSDIATSLTVKPIEPTPNANVASGELEGLVSSALPVVDIPLQGPGVWVLSTTSPSLDQLNCATSTSAVVGSIVLLTSQQCQLQIASATTGASLTWLLTPAH